MKFGLPSLSAGDAHPIVVAHLRNEAAFVGLTLFPHRADLVISESVHAHAIRMLVRQHSRVTASERKARKVAMRDLLLVALNKKCRHGQLV